MMRLPVVYVFTHDSIGIGEDGPTHQPVEHIPSLRAIPGLVVMRPADARETVEAWRWAMEWRGGPVALALTRQSLPILDASDDVIREGVRRGAYVLSDAGGDAPDAILIATGSEVSLASMAAEALEKEGVAVRVVSMPSWELFAMQPEEYRQAVLPDEVKARVAIEAAAPLGWERWVGDRGRVIGLERFGASAPGKVAMEKLGFNVENVVRAVREMLG
jgi:transketolase